MILLNERGDSEEGAKKVGGKGEKKKKRGRGERNRMERVDG